MIIGEESNNLLKGIEEGLVIPGDSSDKKCLCNKTCSQPTVLMIVALMKCLSKDVLVCCFLSSCVLRNGRILKTILPIKCPNPSKYYLSQCYWTNKYCSFGLLILIYFLSHFTAFMYV